LKGKSLNLKGATNKLAGLITRLEHEESLARQTSDARGVRAYGINTDFVSFGTQELGGLLLTDEDAKEYRQCVDAIYAEVSGKTERISRSAVESFIQAAILKGVDPARAATETDFSKRLESALVTLEEELQAKPSTWEVHFPVKGLLTDKLPTTFGKCEFYFGDDAFLNRLLERVDHVLSNCGHESAQEAKQGIRDRIQQLVRGTTWVFTLTDAVDGKAAWLIAQKTVRQTVDILNFYAHLGGGPPPRFCLRRTPVRGY